MGWVFLLVIALVFAVVWINLARRPGPRAKLGPDGTNVRSPETFVVHHEGKAQGLDIANTALTERTAELSRDLPGDTHRLKVPIPGRDRVAMTEPPSDHSDYGDQKVAPGATPGEAGAEPKAKVLMEGPVGSRPETPEEPGSPYAKGRRVTDIHRDVELAQEVLPAAYPGQGRHQDRDLALSPSTTGQEPGYGLGRTRPGETDGEGGPVPAEDGGPEEEDDFPVEQPEVQDDLTDIPGGEMPVSRTITFRPDFELGAELVEFEPNQGFEPDPGFEGDPDFEGDLVFEADPDWSPLDDHDPLPAGYGEDRVTAIVRNPRSLYLYWERDGGGEDRLRELLGEQVWASSILCLRIFDTTTAGFKTIDLTEGDDHWFLHGLEPNRRYVIALERRTTADRYYLLALSAPVSTPPESPAPASRGGLLEHVVKRQAEGWVSSPAGGFTQ